MVPIFARLIDLLVSTLYLRSKFDSLPAFALTCADCGVVIAKCGVQHMRPSLSALELTVRNLGGGGGSNWNSDSAHLQLFLNDCQEKRYLLVEKVGSLTANSQFYIISPPANLP
jgi:hypothetical protein